MARIVYGVSGEGSGHSSRSRVILSHLIAAGHEVRAASYGRGCANLEDDFDVLEIQGLRIAASDNSVSLTRTVGGNLARLPELVAAVREVKRQLFERFRPHCVFTDFEPSTAYLARHFELPLVSLDNQHRMRYMRHPVPRGLRREALMTKAIIRAMVPPPDVSLIATFHFGTVQNRRTFLFPPILRREVLDLEPSDGDHVVAYFNKSYDRMLELFERFPRQRFIVYGQQETPDRPNVRFRPFGKAFLVDLASAKAVIATAGFTLTTETLHLGKPFLALPMKGQFEQQLNALMLEDLGYGRNGGQATAGTLRDFFDRLSEYRERLSGYRAEDNRRVLAKVDELLDDDCALLRRFQTERRGLSWPPP